MSLFETAGSKLWRIILKCFPASIRAARRSQPLARSTSTLKMLTQLMWFFLFFKMSRRRFKAFFSALAAAHSLFLSVTVWRRKARLSHPNRIQMKLKTRQKFKLQMKNCWVGKLSRIKNHLRIGSHYGREETIFFFCIFFLVQKV